ncbi:MAG: hypothetical protein IID41_10580 [Planctomycetes bacterium]|nr:hypothetical protein [Planctomycetota bacterium]
MAYDLSPDGPPNPPRDAEMPLPGERDRRSDNIDIEDDVCCVHCGYNLRGLTKRHRCPECGTPAGFSVEGDLLKYAPIPWIRTVRNGLAMFVWSIGIHLLSIVSSWVMPDYGVLLDLVSAVLAIVGAMFVTVPEPTAVAGPGGFGVRRRIRVLAFVNFVGTVCLIFSPNANFTIVMRRFLLVSWSGMLLALAVYLRKFAARIPEYDLEIATTRVIWGLTGSLSVFVFFGVWSFVFAFWASVLGPAACVSMLALGILVIFAGWFLWLLYKYYVTMKWTARDAAAQFEPPPVRELDLESQDGDWTDARG